MNWIKRLLNLFSKDKNHAESSKEKISESLPTISMVPPHDPKPILYTFYRIGPAFITYCYPVEGGVLKEFTDPNGIIGPSYYYDEQGALKDFESVEELINIKNDKKEQLRKDLLTLAEDHNIYGAYSVLGAIFTPKRREYFRKGAELGCTSCMTTLGIILCSDGNTKEGFDWIKKSADLGEEYAIMISAISYHYGTLTRIDCDLAATYYLKAIKEHNVYWAYINLASMLAESGYFHTALNYLNQSQYFLQKDFELINSFGHLEDYLSNTKTCIELLEMPYSERLKHCVMQGHQRNLDRIFCSNFVPAVTKDLSFKTRTLWNPIDEIDIDERDLEEKAKTFITHAVTRKTDDNEDYVIISYDVKISNPQLCATRKEIIFLEKNCHSELNNFINNNLLTIRDAVRRLGYIFVYLPAHISDAEDTKDLVGSYLADNYSPTEIISNFGNTIMNPHYRTENMYWDAILSGKNTLPDDCAGFLQCRPVENTNDHTNFTYTMIPCRPGTNWGKVFSIYLQHLRSRQLVDIELDSDNDNKGCLPVGCALHITEDLTPTIVDINNFVVAKIELRPLSKIIYALFLNHPEGIRLKELIDYKGELMEYYKKIKRNPDPKKIDDLVDATKNSANEKIARIRPAFSEALKDYPNSIEQFILKGKKGEKYTIELNRSLLSFS